MMAAITILVTFVSPEIIAILGTTEYGSATYIIPVVTLGVYFTFVYDLYASVEFYYGATKYVMYASVTGAILNVILNAIFIPIYGFIAAAYTTLVCYVVFMLIHYLFSKRVCMRQSITENVYDNRMIILISCGLGVLCLSGMLTFNYPVMRVFLIALILCACVYKRSTIIDLIGEIKR